MSVSETRCLKCGSKNNQTFFRRDSLGWDVWVCHTCSHQAGPDMFRVPSPPRWAMRIWDEKIVLKLPEVSF